MKNKSWILFMLIIMAALVAGCASNNGQPAATAPDKNTVLIQDFKFQPAEITIQKGEAVVWINKDSAGHTATGNSFDSGMLSKDQSFKQTFNEAGTFDYICTPHPYMKGKVIVK